MNYINRSSVHWRFKGRQSCGASLCGSTDNIDERKGGERCWNESITIHISVREVQQSIEVQMMAKARQREMELERCELEIVAKRRHAILNKATLLEKGIKILDLDQLMWTCKQNRIMISMLSGWRTGRILLRKKTKLLQQGLFLCFSWISKHQCSM